jgi:HAMP domain-containing protein
MTLLAVTTAEAILAWIGIMLLLVVAVVVLVLLENVRRPIDEIDRYADHILEAGVGIAKNLDDADELLRTQQLGDAVPGLAVGYLKRAGLA